MGIFSPDRQSRPYAPPIDGSNPTLLGGLSHAAAGPVRDSQRLAQAPDVGDLPAPAGGTWRIEMRYLPIGHRGHAFLTLVDPDGRPRQQLHGLAESRNTGEIMTFGPDGSKLVARSDRRMPAEETPKIADVAHGSYDEIVRGKWARGLQTADEINKRNFDYKSHDPSYEFGGDGGQIQNSNSAAYTYGKAMDLDLDKVIREAGMERRFSGWNRNLLDPNYKRYVMPSTFPNTNVP